MAYRKYKDSTKRTGSNNVLRYKAFKTANNPKYNGCEKGLASMVYKILIKKSTASDIKSTTSKMNFINQLLKNLKDVMAILLLKTIFWELIFLICN